MAITTEISWDDGSGDKIYVTRETSEGNQTVSVSSDENTGAARTKVVTFTSGVGNIQRQLTINQAAGLPYTPLNYIETDGVAYIDTKIKGNVPKSFRFKVMPVAPSSGNAYYFGCRKDTGNTRFVPLIVTSGKKAGFGYGSGVYISTIDISASIDNQTPMDVQCVLKASPQSFGVKQAGESSYTTMSGTSSGTQTTNRNMLIFGYDYAGTSVSHCPSGVKWYECKVYSSSNYTNLVFDGVPCYYNGEYGLWDKISDTFFGNAASSGAFTGQ